MRSNANYSPAKPEFCTHVGKIPCKVGYPALSRRGENIPAIRDNLLIYMQS